MARKHSTQSCEAAGNLFGWFDLRRDAAAAKSGAGEGGWESQETLATPIGEPGYPGDFPLTYVLVTPLANPDTVKKSR